MCHNGVLEARQFQPVPWSSLWTPWASFVPPTNGRLPKSDPSPDLILLPAVLPPPPRPTQSVGLQILIHCKQIYLFNMLLECLLCLISPETPSFETPAFGLRHHLQTSLSLSCTHWRLALPYSLIEFNVPPVLSPHNEGHTLGAVSTWNLRVFSTLSVNPFYPLHFCVNFPTTLLSDIVEPWLLYIV